jgi:hypothetical protein
MFPIPLKNADILRMMQEVNVPLTERELTEPGRCKERIREVFVQLVSNKLGEGIIRYVLISAWSLFWDRPLFLVSSTPPPTFTIYFGRLRRHPPPPGVEKINI